MLQQRLRKSRKISSLIAAVCSVVFFIAAGCTYSYAAQITVFVAGNPDLYPIEYYDSKEKQYLGLMPEMYALLSEKTGYEFRYINADSVNEQQRMAKNSQAEVISAFLADEMDSALLKEAQNICSVEIDGQKKNVRIAFTDIASEELISEVSRELGEITTEQKLLMVTAYVAQNGNNGFHRKWIYFFAIGFGCASSTVLILVIYIIKKRKSSRRYDMLDPTYGIGNDKYYAYCFNSLISDKSKSLYFIAYIAFDEKEFNKQYGASVSKDVQRYVSVFLNTQTAAVEYIAIMNEGVFAFLYQSANITEAEKRIESIMNGLDTYLSEFGSEYAGLFCAGVCSLEDNMDADSEFAFYNAKQGYLHAQKNEVKYAFSTKKIVEDSLRNERFQKNLMHGIDNGEFKIYLQYIVDRNGKIFGAEAISRWHNPKEGLISPEDYIKMMTQSDVVTKHDLYIFSHVCAQLEEWNDTEYRDLCISCNFTRYSITSFDFADRLKEVLDKYKFKRGNLIIEITEGTLSYNTKALQYNIEICKKLGMRIALDDIGSGYSSLSDLYHYPIDFVKVERDIIVHSDTERGSMLLEGLVHLAHSMNIQVLCEGIETPEQNAIVLEAGSDFIQGFYYSRVFPQKEAQRFLSNYKNP